jgi:DNA-binding transcriptional LysR family regulator
MAALKGEILGHIVLGASTTIAQYVLPPLLADFCRAYLAAARRVVPSTYQPLAADGYAPWQVDEMLQFAQKTRSAKL